MSIHMAQMVLLGALGYFAVGFVVALIAILALVPRLDAAAAGASIMFRMLIVPGLILLWPVMVVRFASGRKVNLPIEKHGPHQSDSQREDRS
ncbi:MAG: hypothetical protein AAFW83_11670 [Pseudomonadota bacterium]